MVQNLKENTQAQDGHHSANHLISSDPCYLGTQAEKYDAELHAVHEALSYLHTPEITPNTAIICIDNSSAIDTLLYKKKTPNQPVSLSNQQMLSV
jgi:ribonuclease HI